ncbi:MAG: hypothetical protein JNK05_19475 [Myxococcales bacterium]|nr:hypothetical protein [Myxococcales bacterium]
MLARRTIAPIALAALALGACRTPLSTTEDRVGPAVPPREASSGDARAASAPRPNEPVVASLRTRIEAVVEAFRERGGRAVDAEWSAFVPPGGARVATVRVGRGQCLGFVAVGVRALRKVGLRIHDSSGILLGENASDATPYLRLCARAESALSVVLRAVEGQGQLALLVVAQPPVVAPDLDRVLGDTRDGSLTGPRTPRAAVGADPAVEIALDAAARQRSRLAQLGYRPLAEALTGEVDRRAPAIERIELEAGRCYGVLVTTDADSEPLTLELRDPDGRAIVPQRTLDRDPLVRGCVVRSGMYQVRLTTRESARFALQALLLDERLALPSDVVGEVRAGVLELHGEALTRSLGHVRTLMRVAAAVAPLTMPIDFVAHQCAMLSVATAGTPVELSLSDDRGALVASDTGGAATPRVWYCADRARTMRITVRSATNRGEFLLAVFDDGAAP